MKFSIIVPVYNVEAYISDCIESILQQTFVDFELILVDNGSTDSSGDICDSYAKTYQDRMRVIHTDNIGVGLARVKGIENAAGEILLFVDSDDCIRKDALERIANKFDTEHCDMVIFNASRNPDYSDSVYNFPIRDKWVFETNDKPILFEEIVTTRNLNTMWQKAVSKKVALKAVKSPSNFGVKNGQDLIMSMSVLTFAEKICLVDENLYFYRDRGNSAVHTVSLSRIESVKIVHTEMSKYIDIWNLPELHKKHGARIVKSWLELLTVILESENGSQKEKKRIISSFAEDSYFRTAYNQMDSELLEKSKFMLAKWLYEGKYSKLYIFYRIKSSLKKLRK